MIQLASGAAEYVMREMFESALRMTRLALEKVGLSEEEIDRAEATYRGHDRDRLAVQMEAGDIYAAQDMTREQSHAQRRDD